MVSMTPLGRFPVVYSDMICYLLQIVLFNAMVTSFYIWKGPVMRHFTIYWVIALCLVVLIQCTGDNDSSGDGDIADGDMGDITIPDGDNDDFDSPPADGDEADGDAPDGDDLEDDLPDGDDPDGDDPDGDDPDGDDPDGDDPDGDDPDGDVPDGDDPDGDDPDGDDPDGDDPDGDNPDGDDPDGDVSDGDVSDGDDVDGDMTDSDDSDADVADGDQSDGDLADGDVSDGDDPDGDDPDGDVSDGDIDDDDWDLDLDPDETFFCDPDPCADDELRFCDEDTGDCLCDEGYCDIEATCIPDTLNSPDHACMYCDSEIDKYDWTLRGSDYPCRESSGECDESEFCDGESEDCPINGFSIDWTLCQDDEDDCNGVKTCQSGACVETSAAVVCQAIDECHLAGECNPDDGSCSNPNADDGSACGVDDQCVAGQCLDCFDTSGCVDLEWGVHDDQCSEKVCGENGTCEFSMLTDGTSCGLENQDQCAQGACADCHDEAGCGDYTADDNDCTDIGCHENACADIPDDSNTCSDGHDCTDNACLQGVCVIDEVHTGCMINDTCYEQDARLADTGDDSCKVCDSGIDDMDWTTMESGSCDDDDFCTNNDVCGSGGVCAGEELNCGNGICVGPNTCQCDRGYAQPDCSECATNFYGLNCCEEINGTAPYFNAITEFIIPWMLPTQYLYDRSYHVYSCIQLMQSYRTLFGSGVTCAFVDMGNTGMTDFLQVGVSMDALVLRSSELFTIAVNPVTNPYQAVYVQFHGLDIF